MYTQEHLLVATGPHGFPGAGQIMSQNLRGFARAGHTVVYVGTKAPFLFGFMATEGVHFSLLSNVSGGVIREDGAICTPDVLLSARLADTMCSVVQHAAVNVDHIILWGTYLYPYGLAAFMAAAALTEKGRAPKLWITPAGSDVWEIGPQLQIVTEWMLSSKLVQYVITYTDQFAEEIATRYHMVRPTKTIYPMLDADRFRAFDGQLRVHARRELQIPKEAFVVVSHSNMRSVKQPNDVIAIADTLAKRIERQVVLLMIGPESEELISLSSRVSCRVVWTGVQERVERLLVAGDVELNCSSHDSFNLSLAEAMACGMPCVSTDVVGIAPEVRAAGAGCLFPYEPVKEHDPDAPLRYEKAVSYLARLASNETLRRELGERARRHALDKFSSEKIMPQYLSLLK